MKNQLNVRLDADSYQRAKQAAAKAGRSLSDHVRDLLCAPAAQLLSVASGGRWSVAYCSYCLLTAERLIDSPDWRGTEIAEWLCEAERVVGIARRNPYCLDTPKNVAALLEAIPEAVTDAMRAECVK